MAQQFDIKSKIQGVSTRSAIKYALLPGIIPRLRSLAGVIGNFLFMFTQLFGAVGLIERNHPCLKPQNIGHYRFRDVVGLAASRVVFTKKNLPQTLMFFAILGSIVLTIAVALSGLALIILNIPAAHAQFFSPYAGDVYDTKADWSYNFLSEVFGKTGLKTIWGGENVVGQNELKSYVFHNMLRSMFSTYSQALLLIAAFMVLYLIITTIAEAARTGQPFGSNFNSVWAPIRLALGIGLLIPISGGYNGAQLVAFQVSEWGSNLATNVWNKSIDATTSSGNLIAAMQPSEGYSFMRGLFLTALCIEAVEQQNMAATLSEAHAGLIKKRGTDGFKVYDGTVYRLSGRNASLVTLNADYCGSLKIPEIANLRNFPLWRTVGDPVLIGHAGNKVSSAYNYIFNTLYKNGENTPVRKAAKAIIAARMCKKTGSMSELSEPENAKYNEDVALLHKRMLAVYREALGYDCEANASGGAPQCGYFRQSSGADWPEFEDDSKNMYRVMKESKRYGWTSAGSYMMVITAVNATVSSAVSNAPGVISSPRSFSAPSSSPMSRNASIEDRLGWWARTFTNAEDVKAKVEAINQVLQDANTWFVDYPNNTYAELTADNPSPEQAKLLIDPKVWDAETADTGAKEQYGAGGQPSPFVGPLNLITGALITVTQEAKNPLAEIAKMGVTLIWAGTQVIEFTLPLNFFLEGMLSVGMAIATPLILTGYLLSVALPSALFMNFLFAVMEWVISVFEAVVGMPLWALSFISISGEGIGDKAMGGLMKLFEILLRPAVIVICTVGAMLIFSASIHFFNYAFTVYFKSFLDASNDSTGALMLFASIFMYVLCIYSVGNSCFKMIPTIANQFMIWIGGPQGFSGTMQADMDKVLGYGALAAALGIGNSMGGVKLQSWLKPKK